MCFSSSCLATALYCTGALGIGVAVNRYQYIKTVSFSTQTTNLTKELEALDDCENDRYWYWRLGAFALGISVLNFIAVGTALAQDTNVSKSFVGATLGALPTVLFGAYYVKSSSDEIKSIKRQRYKLIGGKKLHEWKIKKEK